MINWHITYKGNSLGYKEWIGSIKYDESDKMSYISCFGPRTMVFDRIKITDLQEFVDTMMDVEKHIKMLDLTEWNPFEVQSMLGLI